MADRKITDLNTLTAPVTSDLIPIVDVSEAANVDKNKNISFGAMFRALPAGTQGAPSLGWLSDNGVTGIYRVAENEIGFTANSSYVAKITSAGFQVGTGTAAAQLHLFSSDTTDQVIIENTDSGVDTAPDVVLYRNSASPAASDNLGNIEFRGKDAGGNDHAYAQIIGGIQTTTDASEDGILDLMSSASGTVASRIRLYGSYVGVGESTPAYPLHLTTSLTGTALQLECTADDAASAADITLYHHRNDTAGIADDIISTIFYRAKNDNATPADIDYAAIEGDVSDPTDTAEVGRLKFQVQTAGTLTTQFEIDGDTIGFFGTTAASQPSAIANITSTATSGALPTADGSVTIADATTPTVTELLEYCVELEAKLESALAALRTLGLIAT